MKIVPYSILAFILLLIVSCSSTDETLTSSAPQAGQSVTRIAVLPAVSAIKDQEGITFEEARILDDGADFITSVLKSELTDHPKVRFVDGYGSDMSNLGNPNAVRSRVKEIGEKYACDAVLITSVKHFEQRLGGDLSVDSPASAFFTLQLIASDTGRTLWTGTFKETQQSLLSNLLTFGQAQTRGFKWITVEEMVTEGVKEKLADCPYL